MRIHPNPTRVSQLIVSEFIAFGDPRQGKTKGRRTADHLCLFSALATVARVSARVALQQRSILRTSKVIVPLSVARQD